MAELTSTLSKLHLLTLPRPPVAVEQRFAVPGCTCRARPHAGVLSGLLHFRASPLKPFSHRTPRSKGSWLSQLEFAHGLVDTLLLGPARQLAATAGEPGVGGAWMARRARVRALLWCCEGVLSGARTMLPDFHQRPGASPCLHARFVLLCPVPFVGSSSPGCLGRFVESASPRRLSSMRLHGADFHLLL